MLRLLHAVVFAGGVALIFSTWPTVNVTFDVSAETDMLTYFPDASPDTSMPFRWGLPQAQFREELLSRPRKVTGEIRFLPPLAVRVSRASTGPLRIALTNLPDDFTSRPLGTLRLYGSTETIPLHSGAVFVIENLDERAGRGEPMVLPLAGALIVGNGAISTGGASHMVGTRSGSIDLLFDPFSARINKDTSVLTLRSVVLRPGDTFRMSRVEGAGIGAAIVDERPLLNVAYRASGNKAKLERLHGRSRSITASLSDALVADPVALIVTGVVLILLTFPEGMFRGILQRLLRRYG